MSSKFLMLTGMLATGLALAQGAPPAGGGGGAPPQSSGKALDQSPLFNAVDANHDGKVTKEEWKAAGLADFVYDMADSKKAGSFTLAELSATSPPEAMDTNKDGKISLDEMKAFLATMGNGGGAPGGGAPPGGGSPPSGGSPPASK